MPDILLDRIKELSPTLALIVVIALGAAGIAMWFQEGALKEPGHDRDRLVRSLRLGGDLRRHYVFWVSRALNRVDRFLGDDGKAEWSLRVRLIDNHRPAPYWTGWSFDKCALLAVVYPLAAMFCTWAWAGEAGEFGDALGFAVATSSWRRAIVLVFVVGCGIAITDYVRSSGWRSYLAFAFAVALVAAVLFAGVGAVGVAVAVALVVARLIEGANAKQRIGSFWLAYFWLAYWPIAFGACYLGVWAMGRYGAPALPQVLLVMFGVVPLVNVPFDWASVGFTRALLRRGCARRAVALMARTARLRHRPCAVGAARRRAGCRAARGRLDITAHRRPGTDRPAAPAPEPGAAATRCRELVGLFHAVLHPDPERPEPVDRHGQPGDRGFSLAPLAARNHTAPAKGGLGRDTQESAGDARRAELRRRVRPPTGRMGGRGAVLYLGQYVLFGFLYEAVLLEWLLPT